jgi:RNA-directed DNA polymerase
VWRQTAKKRLVAKLHDVKVELIRQRHAPVAGVGEWLRKVVSGYYQYHAVLGNMSRLSIFRHRLRQLWWVALTRRSQRGKVSRERMRSWTGWVPVPRVLHPYPRERFDATHPRWKPYA